LKLDNEKLDTKKYYTHPTGSWISHYPTYYPT